MWSLKSSGLVLWSTLCEPGLTRSRSGRLRRAHRRFVTEPLEVRQLLTGDYESALRIGSTGYDSGIAIATDANGNVYVTGYFEGTVDFDPGAGVTNLVSAGDFDIFVTKTDGAGNMLWARRMGGLSREVAYGIAVDGSGNVYTTGVFPGTVDFDPGPGTANLTSAGSNDVFVSKLDSAGNHVWAKRFGAGGSDVVEGIAVEESGHVFTTGSFSGTVDFDPGAGTANLTSAGGHDVFVSRLDSAGSYVWAKRFGGTGGESAKGIAIDGAGNVYTTGNFTGTADFDPGALAANLTSAGETDVFVSCLDSVGNFFWARRFGGISYDNGEAIAVDGSGAVVTTGLFYGTVDFDPGAGTANLTSTGESDMFVSRLDSVGNYLWAKGLAGSETCIGQSIAVDNSGNVYSTGYFWGTADFDPGPGAAHLTSAGFADAFVSRLDSAGHYVWAKRLGGSGDGVGEAIAVDDAGNVYTTGYFSGVADLDPGIGTSLLTSAGNLDGFVSRLSPDMVYVAPPSELGELRLQRNGSMLELRFNDPTTPGVSTLLESHPLAAIRSVRITGSTASFHALTIDFAAGGSFTVAEGIHYDGGISSASTLRLIGVGNEGFSYLPSSTIVGAGKFRAYGEDVSFTAVEMTGVSRTQALSIEPVGSTDVLSVVAATGYEGALGSQIFGTSDGLTVVPITIDNVRDLTIDTGLNDAAVASSNDVVTCEAGSLAAQGLKNVFVRTGKGNDVLAVNGPNIGLPVSDGRFWFLGGADVDRLSATGDTNWDLNDTRLVSAGGGRIMLDDIEKATLTGGASRNHLNASLFTGDANLDGAANNDLLRGGSGNDIINGGTGNDRMFGSSGDDVLQGQDGDDQIWGDVGDDTLRGGNGNDRLFGGDDNDYLYGDANNDLLDGGSGDDALIGGSGVDLYGLQGTGSAEDLHLQRVSATSAVFRRKPRGLTTVLEQDAVTMDATDELLISALGGDDLITIDSLFTQLGSVDGGDGADACTAPAAWTVVSC